MLFEATVDRLCRPLHNTRMTQLIRHHSSTGVHDHTWEARVYPDGVAVKVEWFPEVNLTWEQILVPELLAARFGFMHVTGFVILVETLAELFHSRSQA